MNSDVDLAFAAAERAGALLLGRAARDPGCVKTRTTGRQSINLSRFSAHFCDYWLGGAKKVRS
jgi:hypothetical protein